MNTSKNSENGYVYDLKKILRFVFEKSGIESIDREFSEMVGPTETSDTPIMLQKASREVKHSSDEQMQNLKYDLIKNFMDTLATLPADATEEDLVTEHHQAVLNTMLKYKFMKKI